jgi:hypothetical protein
MLTLAILVSAFLAPRPEPKPEPTPLSAHLTADAFVPLGKAPAVKVTIKNLSGREALLVGSLDASDCKWRYPHCWFEIIGPDGKSSVKGIGRCGNTNPLREKDFVKVKAGGTFDPYMRVDDGGFFSAHQIRPENFPAPGTYRIRFHYSTAEKAPARWNGKLSGAMPPAVPKLLERVPKATIQSNEVKVRVVKPGAK